MHSPMNSDERWILDFEGLPPSPNDRLAYFQKAQSNRKWRMLACQKAQAAGIPRMDRAKVSFTIYRKALGRADEDNDRARFKPIVDGLRDAGVIDGDARGQIIYGRCDEKQRKGTRGFEMVIEAKPSKCSRCMSTEEDVQPFMQWFFCLACYAAMCAAFLRQRDYDRVRDWLGGSQGNGAGTRKVRTKKVA